MGVVGHTWQREQLIKLFTSERLPGTMLFYGPAGIGKQLVAKELSRTVLCDTPGSPCGGCGTCQSCLLINANTHPDNIFLEIDQSKISDLRDLFYALHLKPYRNHSRVVILNNADSLTTQMANVLLKSLEEPKPDTRFILIAASLARIPETVLSRCYRLPFSPLTDSDIRSIISRNSLFAESTSSLDDLVLTAAGSLESVQSLITHHDELPLFREVFADLESHDTVSLLNHAAHFAKKKELIIPLFDYLRARARATMRGETDPQRMTQWAIVLANLIYTERIWRERNFNPHYLLATTLSFCTEVLLMATFTEKIGDDMLLSARLT